MACKIVVDRLEVNADGRNLVRARDLTWGPGGLHFIIGPNGAGKTTLLRALAGIAPYKGAVSLCGAPPRRAKRLIAYLPASPAIDPWARVSEVERAASYGSMEAGSGLPVKAFEESGLGWVLDLRGRRFGELSSGEQRLVLIMAAIKRGPRVLIADEPLSFLDISNQVKVLALFSMLARSMTILMTTHDIVYAGYANTVTLISRGEVVYSGASDRLPVAELERAYGVKIEVAEVSGVRIYLPSVAQVVRERFTAPPQGAPGSTQRSS